MWTRREFLGRSRHGLAAAASVPLVWSRVAGMAANERIAVGVIGVGTMGRGHLGAMLGRSDVQVVAVCDVVRERLEHARQRVETHYASRNKSGTYSGVGAYSDFRELLRHPGLDAVIIATPDHWHAMPCVLAARAKKHIYCEKPLTHNVAEGRQIVEAVRRAGVIFQTGSQQRSEFGNRFRAAVEMIWNGWIGKIKTIRIGVGGPARPCDLPAQEAPPGTDWDFWLGPAPERPYHSDLCPKGVHNHFPAWRNYQEYAGGGLADMGAHHFDIAQWALKKDDSGPVEVIPPDNPKRGAGLRFVYADGTVMIHNEFEGNIRADCVFEGSDGTILVGRGQLEVRFRDGSKARFPDQPQRVYPSHSHHGNWLECIRSGRECICPAEVGHRTATICHLANIGYRLGRKLRWDPIREQFINDQAANQQLSREPRPKWKLV